MPAMCAAVKLRLLLLLGAFLAAPIAGAFSADGHRVAGGIADQHLCPETRDWLAPLLDGATLADAGVWADTIRGDPAWEQAAPWHFINVGDRESIRRAMRGSRGNVLTAIDRFERELADPRQSRQKRSDALRFLVHFIADVHQPLHVGRADDRGGNDVTVVWGRSSLDLHEFWDARGLLRGGRLTLADQIAAIAPLVTGQAQAWQGRSAIEWAEESRAFRPFVYAMIGGSEPVRLTPAYVAGARNIVELRLAQAGVRIAERLNRIACPGMATEKRSQAIEPAIETVGSTH